MISINEHRKYHILIWLCWFAWVSFWWNRGLFPNDEGAEPVFAYLWNNGMQPYVDYYGASTDLTGIVLFRILLNCFGFVPWVWRVGFILVYGACAGLIYDLLRRLVRPRTAFWSVLACVVFFANCTRHPYLWYNWVGVLAVLLELHSLHYSMFAKSRINRLLWGVLAGICAVIAFFAKPTLGIAVVLGIVLVLFVAMFGSWRRVFLEVFLAWVGAASISVVSVLLWLHLQGLLGGFMHVAEQVIFYMQRFRGHASIWISIKDMGAMFKFFPYSLAGPMVFLSVLFLLAKSDEIRPKKRKWFLVYVPCMFMILSCLAMIVFPRPVLSWMARWNIILYLAPLAVFVSLPFILMRLRCLYAPDDGEDSGRSYFWLLLFATAGAVWVLESLAHPGNWKIYGPMLIILLPAIWAFLCFEYADRFVWRHARWWYSVLIMLVVVFSIAQRVAAPFRERPWWEPYTYFKYPALRFLKASNSADVDRMLFLARDTVRKGGRILVYPEFFMVYALADTLIPSRIFNYWPPTVHSPPDDEWEKIVTNLSESSPELIVIQNPNLHLGESLTPYYSLIKWRKKWPDHFPLVIKELMDCARDNSEHDGYLLVFESPAYAVYKLRNFEL